MRQEQSRPIVDRFFGWCDALVDYALDDTPLAKAIGYARNRRAALRRILDDGRLPLHNNASELQLRREVIGRRNWWFVGSGEAAEVNTTFVSLLASCGLHQLEPWAYLRDLLCLLPGWPRNRVLQLAPAYWKQTSEPVGHPDDPLALPLVSVPPCLPSWWGNLEACRLFIAQNPNSKGSNCPLDSRTRPAVGAARARGASLGEGVSGVPSHSR